MPRLPCLQRVSDIQMGSDPVLDAWLYHFLVENNIEHMLNPAIVAGPEQLRFMVALQDEQVYLPCDDELFFYIYRQEIGKLSNSYLKAWRFVVGLVRAYKLSNKDARRILTLCRHRFTLFLLGRTVLPSRMVKRLLNIVVTQCGNPEHFREKKSQRNKNAAEFLAEQRVQELLHACPSLDLACISLPRLRQELYITEMSRLLVLSTLRAIWEGGVNLEEVRYDLEANTPRCTCLCDIFGGEDEPRKKVLYIPDVAGAFLFDLAFVQLLLRQGHQVVLVMKGAFYFDSPVIRDVEAEPLLKAALRDAYLSDNALLSKNDLLQLLRERQFVILSDGLSEQLNLYRASVSFARAWKECDVVIAKGQRNKQVLLGSSHEFTRDILCCWRDEKGFFAECKPRASWVRQFSEQEILDQARNLVDQMRRARSDGKTTIFYSAIVGSIPGQTRLAMRLANVFVEYLRGVLDNPFIINPVEHFEEGMDGDDLMYMWEHVQRSGLLDVWRFQTVEDIEKSFSLLNLKVPSVWSGKDSTFSTGCTKEMRIALDMQKKQPELQIIGPAAENFFRRSDYGVGKYFDAALER